MPRRSGLPPLPRSPGQWLSWFRYRTTTPDGLPHSPESLAPHLSVSGDTVRRWEAGLSEPRREDLQAFAGACLLKAVETAFLLDAFAGQEPEAAPDPLTFVSDARNLLSGEFPAYMFDSLFYVRAWNRYMDLLRLPRVNPPMGEHILETSLQQLPPDHAGLGGNRDERQSRAVLEFWFATARLCGTPAYRDLIARLSANVEFCDRWIRIAQGNHSGLSEPVIAPYYVRRREIGTYRVVTSRIAVPPVFYLREYIPIDDAAQGRLKDSRAKGPPTVSIRPQVHWADFRPASIT